MTNLQAWQKLCVEESTFKRIRKHQNAGSFGSWPALSFGRSGRSEAGGWSVGYPPSITRGTCPSFATFSDWTALQQVARWLSWSYIASRSVLSSQSFRLSIAFGSFGELNAERCCCASKTCVFEFDIEKHCKDKNQHSETNIYWVYGVLGLVPSTRCHFLGGQA